MSVYHFTNRHHNLWAECCCRIAGATKERSRALELKENVMDKRILFTAVAFTLMMLLALSVFGLEDPEVSAREARRNAAMSVIEHVGFEAPFVEEWRDAALGEPQVIFDPSGVALLYRFPVTRWDEIIGSVDAAATPFFGATVVALTVGEPDYELEWALEEAVAVVESLRPGSEITASALAIYQYPRIGLLVEFVDPDRGFDSVILDPETLEPISGRGGGRPGTVRVVSLAEDLRHGELAEVRAEQFREETIANLEMGGLLRAELDIDPELYEPLQPDQWANVPYTLANLGWNQAQVRAVDASRLKLIKQEKWDWCARAVAQMIEYYHTQTTTLTQTQIDTILDNDGWWTDWTTALVNFYRQRQGMSNSWLEQRLTTSTTSDATKQQQGFQEFQQQINDGFPFSDNIDGHARMGVGYRVTNKHTGVDYFEVGIYDPLQVGGGIRWETGWTDSMVGFQAIGTSRHFPVYVRDMP